MIGWSGGAFCHGLVHYLEVKRSKLREARGKGKECVARHIGDLFLKTEHLGKELE